MRHPLLNSSLPGRLALAGLAWVLIKRERYAALGQSHAVLAVGFATLAVPLALVVTGGTSWVPLSFSSPRTALVTEPVILSTVAQPISVVSAAAAMMPRGLMRRAVVMKVSLKGVKQAISV